MNPKSLPHVRRELIAVLLITATLFCYSQWESFVNPYVVADDARQHVFWMARFEDESLLQNDFTAQFAEMIQPPGVVAVYRAFLTIFSIQWSMILISLTLALISSAYLWRILRRAMDVHFAWIGMGLFLLSDLAFNAVGGFARSYAFPLLFLFIFYSVTKKWWIVALVIFLSSILYPSVFLLCSAAYGLHGTLEMILSKTPVRQVLTKQRIAPVVIMLVGAAIILIQSEKLEQSPIAGPLVDRAEMEGNPVFGPEGRQNIIPTLPLHQRVVRVAKSAAMPVFGLPERLHAPKAIVLTKILLAAGLLGVAFLFYRRIIFIPHAVLALFLSSLVLYVLADWLMMRLYLPSRYMYGATTFFLLVFSYALAWLGQKKWGGHSVTGIMILLFVSALPGVRNATLSDFTDSRGFCSFISNLPENSMTAGPPTVADNIPMFARRRTFVGYESSHAVFFKNYWAEMERRNSSFWRAYYTDDPQELMRFIQTNKIDYMLVDRKLYERDKINEGFYFEPFNSRIKEMVRERRSFALDTLTRGIVYEDDRFKLIDAGVAFPATADHFRRTVALFSSSAFF